MARHGDNPYPWHGRPSPHHPIIRRPALLEEVSDEIAIGKSNYLIGCRGMGKSVFIGELASTLRSQSEYEVIVVHGPPSVLDVPHMVHELVESLIDASAARGHREQGFVEQLRYHGEHHDVKRVFKTYLDTAAIERLVLLYDELDRYGGDAGRHFFNSIEDTRKNSHGQLVVFAAGGIGLVAVDTVIGSSFFSRMQPHVLEPFSRTQVVELAKPFALEGRSLPEEVIDTLLRLSGGNGLMTAYGLNQLWEIEELSPGLVGRCFSRLLANLDVIQQIREPIFAPGNTLPKAPKVVWERLFGSAEALSNEDLRQLVDANKGPYDTVDARWVLRMLRASGLIRCANDSHLQPKIEVEIIPSILTLQPLSASAQASTLSEQLSLDLPKILALIHRMSVDFFQQSKGKSQTKKPVPESVFSAAIAMSLELMGWRVDREAQSAAGRTDIKATHPGFADQVAIIEVKIWPRNDYKDIHAQVMSYWANEVTAMATVMVGTLGETWRDDYVAACLHGKVGSHELVEDSPDFLAGHFTAPADKAAVPKVDHFLLRLARR